jgi:hypothetical protein
VPWSYYATPLELGFKPWAPDFAPNNYGDDPFPRAFYWDPNGVPLHWQDQDWDPTLRFWNLPFDPRLGEWLKTQDSSRPAVAAAREFASQYLAWQPANLVAAGWLDLHELGWRDGWQPPGALPFVPAQQFIANELEQLFTMMEDDRDRYLDECHVQADGLPGYVIKLLGIDVDRKPWTIELIGCCLAIGNIAYMYYKQQFRRARPSTLAPGLAPPFGPPRHPSFPSGHSFLGHLIALILMEIQEIAEIYGEDPPGPPPPPPPPPPRGVRARIGRQATLAEVRSNHVFTGPLLWLANRMAVNRERIGVHYPSDSMASRWIAGSIWGGLTYQSGIIDCPTLNRVLDLARAEWIRY